MIAVIDYGVGNLYSLLGSLRALALEACVTADEGVIREADRIILPGVGAFPDAIKRLKDTGLVPTLCREAERKPLLGICLGMQLLFEESLEYGRSAGLGLIPGRVIPLPKEKVPGQKIPHMGWNSLQLRTPSPILRYLHEGDYVYYVHSYYASECEEYITATSDYGIPVTGAVGHGRVFGTQFHPEKSGQVGLSILRAFAEL